MNLKKDFKKAVILSFFSIICLGVFNQAQAIDMPRIDKSKIRLWLKPGQAESGEIILENITDEAMSIRAYPQDWFYSSGDGSKEFVPSGATSRSCASWVSFSPTDFILAAFSRQKVRYNVKVPAEAGSGGYYSVLFFENMIGKVPELDFKQAVGLNLTVRFATLFYIEVGGGAIERKGELENFQMKKAGLYAPLLISGVFKNTGNVDVIASGVFAIMDKVGRVRGRGKISDLYALPGDNAKLKGIWRESLPAGNYTFVLTLDLGQAGHKSVFEKGPFLIKEIELEIAEDGSLSGIEELK